MNSKNIYYLIKRNIVKRIANTIKNVANQKENQILVNRRPTNPALTSLHGAPSVGANSVNCSPIKLTICKKASVSQNSVLLQVAMKHVFPLLDSGNAGIFFPYMELGQGQQTGLSCRICITLKGQGYSQVNYQNDILLFLFTFLNNTTPSIQRKNYKYKSSVFLGLGRKILSWDLRVGVNVWIFWKYFTYETRFYIDKIVGC